VQVYCCVAGRLRSAVAMSAHAQTSNWLLQAACVASWLYMCAAASAAHASLHILWMVLCMYPLLAIAGCVLCVCMLHVPACCAPCVLEATASGNYRAAPLCCVVLCCCVQPCSSHAVLHCVGLQDGKGCT
jgi:hypothetical protein